MENEHHRYGPPSDSDDSFDNDSDLDKDWARWRKAQGFPGNSPQQALNDAVLDGNLEQVRVEMEKLEFDVDACIMNEYPLLLSACLEGHYDIVHYAVVEKQANVNQQFDSYVPLMLAGNCRKKEPALVDRMVRLLLQHGAIVNVSDKFGCTPLINVSRNGYLNAARALIPTAALDAFDNTGKSALFHAIENNHIEIVQALIDGGVDATMCNRRGNTPAQVAEFNGLPHILEILPNPKQCSQVPRKFMHYDTLRDFIPCIYPKSDCPEYFQEISNILRAVDMHAFLEHFLNAQISLNEFLTIDESKLKSIGIELPIFRSKILKAILDYHMHHWSKATVACMKEQHPDQPRSYHELLLVLGNYYQNLVVIKSSIEFVMANEKSGCFDKPTRAQLTKLSKQLQAYQAIVNEFQIHLNYMDYFTPKQNLLFIDEKRIKSIKKKRSISGLVIKLTCVIGAAHYLAASFGIYDCWFGSNNN